MIIQADNKSVAPRLSGIVSCDEHLEFTKSRLASPLSGSMEPSRTITSLQYSGLLLTKDIDRQHSMVLSYQAHH
jgi:hypothetical protein